MCQKVCTLYCNIVNTQYYHWLLLTIARRKANKRALSMTSLGKSLHDPVGMYEDVSMASLHEGETDQSRRGKEYLDYR